MTEQTPQSRLNDVINEQDALRFFADGTRRWRMPHHKRRIAPSGLDTDSMDFRGVRAALVASDSLPVKRDGDGKLLPIDPQIAREHYDLGLMAIQRAGLLPLDDRFVAGYQRWADAVVRDEARRIAQQAQDALSVECPEV